MGKNELQIPKYLEWDEHGRLLPMKVEGSGSAIFLEFPDYYKSHIKASDDFWNQEIGKYENWLKAILGEAYFWKVAFDQKWETICVPKMLTFKLRDYCIFIQEEIEFPTSEIGWVAQIRWMKSIIKTNLSPNQYQAWEKKINQEIEPLSLAATAERIRRIFT
jgi:hypothetical protein